MSRDINWFEYERRKKALRNTIGSFERYGAGIRRIVAELEADADRAEIHEAKTTTSACPACKTPGSLEAITGYFDPRMVGASKDDPRKYEEGWRCYACSGNFANEDIQQIAA